MKRAASALAALVAAGVALAQQTTPPTTAEPRTSTTPQEQTTPPAESRSTTRMSEGDKQALMNKCVTQVQAANPNVPEKDIRTYCDQEIKTITAPH